VRMLRHWLTLQRCQWRTREQLGKIQTQRLRKTIKHASETVVLYQRKYADAGVRPEDILTINDLTKLPIVRKKELQAAPLSERTASDIDPTSCLPRRTSGSTGAPLVVLEDPQSAAFRDAMFLQLLWAYGVRPFDRICRLVPDATRFSNDSARLADQMGLWGYLRTRRSKRLSLNDDIHTHMKSFSKWKPKVLFAPPSYLKALLRFTEEKERPLSFQLVVTTGEILGASTRTRISEKFQSEVYDYYGMEETGPVAWECPTHAAYHVNVESALLEFLRDGKPAPAGELAEVHTTSFHRIATPIIRYATGDMARRLDIDCPCGRHLPLMSQVQGRSLDFILTIDGRLISPYTIISALENMPGILQYKVVQRPDFSVDIQLVTSPKKDEKFLSMVRNHCQTLLGSNIPVDCRFVDSPVSSQQNLKPRIVESQVIDR
jgi:phenylacetate-coenzyme A ligase PaaK-like adenylate-forming protein